MLPVPRTWLLDFGVSKACPPAETFAIAISERAVLTPDDWRDGPVEEEVTA